MEEPLEKQMQNFWNVGGQQFARDIRGNIWSFGSTACIATQPRQQLYDSLIAEIDEAIDSKRYRMERFDLGGVEYWKADRSRTWKFVKLDADGNRQTRPSTNSYELQRNPDAIEIAWEEMADGEIDDARDTFLNNERAEAVATIDKQFSEVPEDALHFQIRQDFQGGQSFTQTFFAVPK